MTNSILVIIFTEGLSFDMTQLYAKNIRRAKYIHIYKKLLMPSFLKKLFFSVALKLGFTE